MGQPDREGDRRGGESERGAVCELPVCRYEQQCDEHGAVYHHADQRNDGSVGRGSWKCEAGQHIGNYCRAKGGGYAARYPKDGFLQFCGKLRSHLYRDDARRLRDALRYADGQ